MKDKIYQIAGKKFRLKNFDDYTHNEEVKIKSLLGIKDEGDDTVTISSKDNNTLLPLILISDEVNDLTQFDFNECTKGMLTDIATDWIAARFFFTKNSGSYFSELLLKKIAQIENINPNTASTESLQHS